MSQLYSPTLPVVHAMSQRLEVFTELCSYHTNIKRLMEIVQARFMDIFTY